MSLPRLAVTRPVTTTMFFIAVALLGVFSLSRLAIDLIPEVSFPSLTVMTSYSGAAPEEVERLVTIPIEQAVSTVSGVTSMESVSQEGSSRVTLRFQWGTDLEAAANEVRANVERARSRLPDDADSPRVFRFNPNQAPIMTLAISGDMEQAALRRLAEEEFTYYLERLEGVASVDVIGGPRREVRVRLDPTRAQAYGVTIDQVVSSIRAENFNAPAGRVVVGQAQFSLRTQGRLTSVSDLESVLVARREGVQTLLRDVATIEQVDDDEGMLVRVDGRPGILMSIQKQSGANTVQVADAVLAALEDLRIQYPQVNIRPINDSSVFIRQAINNVVQSAIYGGILAAAILLLFLRSVRATVIVGVAIPVSIVASFILIERAGMTLNTMSLGGLALGIGMLVDNSIVVLENIYRHRSLGKDARAAAIEGTEEMALAITASTLTTLAVFLPMMFLSGMSGILFRQLSLMVAFSITCSLMVALTLLPVMASRLIAAGQGGGTGFLAALDRRLEAMFNKSEGAYGAVLQRAVRRPGWVILTALALLVVSLVIFQTLGTELLPATDEGQVGIFLSLPTGTRLEVTDAVARRVEGIIRDAVPELAHMEVRVGSGGFGGTNTHSANITLSLVPKHQRRRSTREVVNQLREALAVLPGVNVRVSERSNFVQRLASGGFGGGASERISLNLLGNDLDLMREVAQDLQTLLSDIPGLVNVQIARDEDQPQFVVRVDRQRAADLGLTATQVARAVQTAVQGQVATNLTINGRDYPVRVSMLADSMGPSPAEIEAIPIAIGGGEFVPLASVGALVQEDAPAAITRLDQQRAVRLTVGTDGIDLGSAVAAVREAVAAYGLPDGVTVQYGGEYEEQQRAFRELLLVLLLAVSLVYLVMASQFESLLDPFIIMFSVPVALPGVVMALWLTRTPLTTQAYMGLIMLGGIVVNNAIVLVDFVNLLRRQGMALEQAVVQGARTRLRPVLMTTGTTVLGLLPLALEIGEGAELQSPLARSVIGGLTMSTLVTLVLIPAIYRWVHEALERRQSRRQAGGARAATPAGLLMLLLFLSLALWAPPAPAQAAHEAITGAQAPGDAPWLASGKAPLDGGGPGPASPRSSGQLSTPVLGPRQAIAMALEGNLALQQARARLEAAQSRLREVEASYRPGVNLDGQWRIQEPLADGRPDDSRQGAVLSLQARQVIRTGQWWGRPNTELELARLAVEGAVRAWEDAREGVVLNTLRAYINVLKAQTAWELAQKALQRAQEALRETELFYRQGMASELDLTQAKARLAAAQSSLNSALRRLELARARFNQEIGQPLDASFHLQPWPESGTSGETGGPVEGDPSAPRALSERAVQEALERRLDVFQARLSYEQVRLQVEDRARERAAVVSISGGVQGSDARLGLEWDSRDRDTLLTVTGDIARGGDDPRSGSSSSSSSNRSRWDVRVGVSWPLFDGGKNEEAARQDRLQLEQARLQVTQAEREAKVSVYDSYFALLEAREREAVARLERELAEGRLQRVQARVRSGVATDSDLLDAELSLWQAEQSLQEARWDAWLAEASYRRALGLPVWNDEGNG